LNFGTQQYEIKPRKEQWARLKQEAGEHAADLAEAWADAIDKEIAAHNGLKVEHAALKALRQVGGEVVATDAEAIKKLVELLAPSWHLGASLKRWAKKKRYL
jgi:hypothetical protein